ncbi:MAG: methyl-accepting chemotaxis protein [Deltaproteobacteria bacterium]|nr:methyl-accepting chemotaxis protein [Deltaproteobacteria bacterium]
MKLLNNMSVGKKIVLLSFTMLLLMMVIAGVGITMLKQLEEQSSLMYGNNLLALSHGKEANIQSLAMSRAISNMALVASDQRAAHRQNFNKFLANVRNEMRETDKLLLTQGGKAAFKKANDAFESLVTLNQELINNMGSKTPEEVAAGLVETRAMADAADNAMTELCDFIANTAKQRSEDMSATEERGFLINIIALVVAVLLGFILGGMIKKAIANPLVEIAGKAGRVAGGDLNQNFHLDRKDELGSLATALEQMVVNLRARIAEAEQKSVEAAEQSKKAQEAMVEANASKEKAEEGQRAILTLAENVEQVVSRLSAATEELSAQVEQSSRGADMQRERVSGSAAAMEEMNSTVLEVARNAGIASEGSENARHKADSGSKIVGRSIEALGRVQKSAVTMSNEVASLGEQAEAIGRIMTVISDIADQTNLLALNAAIEAARAGEAGRGFAVVADEVRKLAEKTMTATKEVGDAITGIQHGTQRSITSMQDAAKNVEDATGLAQESGSALKEIVTESEHVAAQIQAIAAAAEEQSATSEEITRSLDEINGMASENAAAMQQSAQAVSELAIQTQELQKLINGLRKSK